MPRRAILPLVVLWTLATPALAEAKLHEETVSYRQDGKAFQGLLVFDDALKGKRPGVMIVHEWWGRNDYVKRRAEDVARLGYVAFAADMYGDGVTTKDFNDAGKLAGALRGDRPLMRARAKAGWDVLAARPEVDRSRMAAMGYCFGGGVALELARSGADMAAVASFHGNLDTPHPETSQFKGKVMVFHGGEDPFVPMKDVLAFQEEARKAKANYEIAVYGGAVHAFTNPAAGSNPANGLAYNAQADKRSWEALVAFFHELFGR